MNYIKAQFVKYIFGLLDYGKAEKALDRIALYSRVFSFDAWSGLAIGYTFSQLKLQEQFDKQVDILKKYYEGTCQINCLLAFHYALHNDYEKSVIEMDLALQVEPESSTVYNNRGYYKSKLGLFENSIDDFNKSIQLDPKQYFAYSNRGYSKLRLNMRSSIEDIDYALGKCPNNAVAIKNKALWEFQFGNKEKVFSLIQKAQTKKYYYQVEEEVLQLKSKLAQQS